VKVLEAGKRLSLDGGLAEQGFVLSEIRAIYCRHTLTKDPTVGLSMALRLAT